jgi:hypothetical protein
MNPLLDQLLSKLPGLGALAAGGLAIWAGPKITRVAEKPIDGLPASAKIWLRFSVSDKQRELSLQWVGVILPIFGIIALILGVVLLVHPPTH